MRQKKKKRIIIICLLILAGFIGVFVYHQQTTKIVLEFGMFTGSNWGVANANSFVIIDRAIERFEAAHPNVTVHYYSGIAKEDYSEWYSNMLLRGKMPDVFMVLDKDFNQFCSMGILKDLDGFIEQDKEFDPSQFFTTALNIGNYDDSQYALPYEVIPSLLFVNKTLLENEQIPMVKQDWTWNDLYQICQKVTKDQNGDGFLDQFGTYNYNWLNAVNTNGGLFENQTNEFTFTNKNMVESVKFIQRLQNLNNGQKITQEDFNNGKVAFMPLTLAEYRTYKTYPYKIKKYSSFKWDCITFPAGPNGNNLSQVDALLLGMSHRTKHPQLAWEFLKHLTYDTQNQLDIFRYSQGVSVLKQVTGSQEAVQIIQNNMDEDDEVISSQLLCDVIEHGMIKPRMSEYEQIVKFADGEIGKMLEQNKDIDSYMKILQRNLDSYLGKTA